MNSDILAGQWAQLKGKIIENFGRLTNDDLLQIEGSTDRIIGILQQRYGYNKMQAQREWEAFLNNQTDEVATTTCDLVDTTINKVQELANSAAKTLRTVADKVEETA